MGDPGTLTHLQELRDDCYNAGSLIFGAACDLAIDALIGYRFNDMQPSITRLREAIRKAEQE